MKPNHKIAQLLKGHRIDFADQIVLDLIKNNEISLALLAPVNKIAIGSINHFILSTKGKGNKYFTSLNTLLEYCVQKGILTNTKTTCIQTKYNENHLNKSFCLDEDLVNALQYHYVDFAKHYIVDVVTPANAKVENKRTIMYLAPYDLENNFITSIFGKEIKFSTIDDQMETSAFNEVISKKQVQKYIKDYYKTKGNISNGK